MGIVDRVIGKVADAVAARLRDGGNLRPDQPAPGATGASRDPAALSAVFTPRDFTPGIPLAVREPPGAPPRQWQFPVGANLQITPRGAEPTSFEMLRNLADYCDLVRIAVEMRKADLVRLEWSIVSKDKKDSDKYPGEIKTVSTFFESPDRELSWDGWLRSVLEDLLVNDAVSIYRRRARNGELYALEVVDGSSIKPLLDGRGRTPQPPLPAYQQIIYGFPSVDLTTEDLLYAPKNRRPRSVYGSSPVEWIILAVNWYMRREQFNLGYYTFGNIPEGFISTPEGWTPEQIREFEQWFNAVVAGNIEEIRKLRFVGHGFTFTRFRDMNFEVAHEEWLARIITAAYGVNYQRFVQRVVRATAQQAASETADTGLEPDKRFISGLITRIIARDFKMPFLRHQFVGGESQDEAADTTKRATYVNTGIFTRDEVRVLEGHDPLGLPFTENPTVTTPAGPVLLDAAGVQGPASGAQGPPFPGSGGRESDLGPQAPGTEAAQKAAVADLSRWRRKALKAFREGKHAKFESAAIAPSVRAAIAARLAGAKSEADVLKAFDGRLGTEDGKKAAVAGRPSSVTPGRRGDDPEARRRIEEIFARRFRQQGVAMAVAAHELHSLAKAT
ncbi:MAG: phage portal protein [Candidatus Methylomirabilota bacterium]|jgi:hypothetical protein